MTLKLPRYVIAKPLASGQADPGARPPRHSEAVCPCLGEHSGYIRSEWAGVCHSE